MKVYNNTQFSLEEIKHLSILKRGKNNWRQRNMILYKHPTDDKRVISDGITFDDSMRVISDETMQSWALELSQNGDFVTN